jgi:hypothetical protein
MKSTPSSSTKVAYDLRPAKQVERRMILDAFQSLMVCGFPIRDYQYIGFGSIYFVDFILLHKILGINNLLSIEGDRSITKRVEFNKPFDLIKIRMDYSGDVISGLDRDQKSILWLDYDYRLCQNIIEDITLATNILSAGSIILITVDVRPPEDGDTPNDWREYYEKQAGNFTDFDWTDENYAQSNLPKTTGKILSNAILTGMNGRNKIQYYPLFNFLYSDSCPMLTIGGVIGDEMDGRKIAACNLTGMSFIRNNISDDPFQISVPKITKKERHYLDHKMPLQQGWKPSEFEISEEDLMNYNSIYRYYPSFAELLT